MKRRKKAVALRYKDGDRAPRVVAKGKGLLAERILSIAREHGIPIYDDGELVEFLSLLDIYEEIPPHLYRAVAEILAFVYQVTGRKDHL